MKNNVAKILTTIITIFLITMLASVNVYADPNSSKGFADFDDEDAKEQTEELIQNQAKAQNEALQEIANTANNSVENISENLNNEAQENIDIQNELEQNTVEQKEENIQNKSWIIGGIIVLAIIVILIVFIIKKSK